MRLRKQIHVAFSTLSLIFMNTVLAFIGLNLLVFLGTKVSVRFKPQNDFNATDVTALRATFSQASTFSENWIQKNVVADAVDEDKSRQDVVLSEFSKYLSKETAFLPYLQHTEPTWRSPLFSVFEDSFGFHYRRKNSLDERKKKALQVFVFGGSTVFGYFMASDRTLTAVIERELQRRWDRAVEVTNFGALDYSWNESSLLFQRLLHAEKIPDIAIFVDGSHAIRTNGVYFVPSNSEQFRTIWEKNQYHLESKSDSKPQLPFLSLVKWGQEWLYKMKLKSLVKRRYPHQEALDSEDLIEKMYLDYQLVNQELRALSRDFGVKSLWVWQPDRAYKCDSSSGVRTLKKRDQLTHSLYVRFLGHKEMGFINLNELCAVDGQNSPKFVDGFHYSYQFNERLGKKIVGHLESL